MRFSIRTLICFTALVAIASMVWLRLQPRTHFEFVVSGVVASKLEKGSRLVLWNLAPDNRPIRCDLDDLPLRLSAEPLLQQDWYVSFYSPDFKRPVCSVSLCRSLFDKPRRINIKLDSPKAVLRPFVGNWRNPRYTLNISQRMAYRDPPYWDNSSGRLVPSDSIPHLRIENVNSGDVIHDEEMTHGCMGSRWFGRIGDDFEVMDRDRLAYSAIYDSGGLFNCGSAEFNLDYQYSLHGDP